MGNKQTNGISAPVLTIKPKPVSTVVDEGLQVLPAELTAIIAEYAGTPGVWLEENAFLIQKSNYDDIQWVVNYKWGCGRNCCDTILTWFLCTVFCPCTCPYYTHRLCNYHPAEACYGCCTEKHLDPAGPQLVTTLAWDMLVKDPQAFATKMAADGIIVDRPGFIEVRYKGAEEENTSGTRARCMTIGSVDVQLEYTGKGYWRIINAVPSRQCMT